MRASIRNQRSSLAVVTAIAVVLGLLLAGGAPRTPSAAASAAVSPTVGPAAAPAAAPSVVPAVARLKGRQVRIKVKGKRYGKKARVALKGYRGKAKGVKRTVRVKKTKTVKRLKPGRYKVIAKQITRNGAVAKAKRIKPKRITVTKKRGATTRITYRQTKKPTPKPVPTPTLPPGAVAKLGIEEDPFHSSGAYGPYGPNTATSDLAYYYQDAAERLVTVTVDDTRHRLTARTYDSARWSLVKTNRISFSDWPVWGGFLAAEDGNLYVALGRDNSAQSSTAPVVAVRKYSPDWELLGEGAVPGIANGRGISAPFAAGVARMTRCGGDLVLHMARQMFRLEDEWSAHQSAITFRFDGATMKQRDFDGPWVSHSFNQFVGCSAGTVLFVDHGDAYPRAVTAAVDSPSTGSKTLPLWSLPGQTGDNYTGTTVTGLGVGTGRFIIAGTSVPHQRAVNGLTGSKPSMPRNAYLLSSDLGLQAARFKWLTKSTDNNVHSTQPRVTQLAPDRFAVLSSIYREESRGRRHHLRMEYRLVDASGNVLATNAWPNRGFQSVSDPIYLGGKLIWVQRRLEYPDASSSAQPYLFALDLSNPSQPTLVR